MRVIMGNAGSGKTKALAAKAKLYARDGKKVSVYIEEETCASFARRFLEGAEHAETFTPSISITHIEGVEGIGELIKQLIVAFNHRPDVVLIDAVNLREPYLAILNDVFKRLHILGYVVMQTSRVASHSPDIGVKVIEYETL